MSDFLKIVLTLLCLGIVVWTVFRWRQKRSIWLLLAVITAVLAAAAFWLSPVIGGFLGFLALALLFLGLWSKRGMR
jgi:hypothetical protein